MGAVGRKRAAALGTALALVAVFTGCELPAETPRAIAWQGLADGQTVFGIVRLAVRASGASGVRFYLDGLAEAQAIGPGVQAGAVYACDWYTQEAAPGARTLYALASFPDGGTAQAVRTVTVDNRPRASTIPAGVLKLAPANDPAPPQLAPAFQGYWYDPVPLAGPVNTAGAEDSPFVTPDGKTLYFFFTGDVSKDVTLQAQDPLTGLWWTQQVAGQWQEPQRLYLQYCDQAGLDGAATVAGDTLWFASARAGNYRGVDIWTASFAEGRWGRWQNAGALLNQTYDIGELHIAADGRAMYFHSFRPGGAGGMDIWLTRLVDGAWQEPEPLAAVNTAGDEGWPFLTEDGTELWFTRLTPGPAIYRALKVNGVWQPPELVLSNLAGEPTMDRDGNLYFVHHRWDEAQGRVSEADIYICRRR